MYSATFAMTVIIGIAVINLLLGFAAAVLSGRGPKRWSDLERAFVLQPVSLRGVRWGRRAAVEHVDVNPQVARSTPARRRLAGGRATHSRGSVPDQTGRERSKHR